MGYTYKRLEQGQIRIARLTSGGKGVVVEVSVETLDTKIEHYDALSWQWGKSDPAGSAFVGIRDGRDGELFRMKVPPNLLCALVRIRDLPDDGFQSLRLWADFICINQNDDDERSTQVAMMTQIYEQARTVHIWLGEPGVSMNAGEPDGFNDKELVQAVQGIKLLGDLDDANHLGSVDMGMRHKAGLFDLEPVFKLLKRGWFGRRWTIQASSLIPRKESLIVDRGC
ncbi:heterokaryon incompatibility protein-domain-containing protein [Xylaria palmicola]|nr:heterokaryon incompatibility protein-domain-containing protein [Xylaria palmicola]